MEGNQVIQIAGYEAYYNKGKRCLAIKMHDGTTSKLIVTEPPESPDDLPEDTPHS